MVEADALKHLNDNQRDAVLTTEGPVLVIAGPGSGKTSTLVERIIHLVKNKNVEAEEILVGTFTEKASKELITRVSDKVPEINLNEMYIGTLHSIFMRILEENREFTRLKRNYKLLDDFEQQYLIYQDINLFEDVEDFQLILPQRKWEMSKWQKAQTIKFWVNKLGEENIDLSKLLDSTNPKLQVLARLKQKYDLLLKRDSALDFATIQTEVFNLFESYPDALKKLNDKIKYIMVDEYQDTNTIQELILLKLMGEKKNIFAVGDDDQGLYRFRGATIRNILEFPDNFAEGECKKIYLSLNYRSEPGIIDFYNNFIKGYEGWEQGGVSYRFDKNIEAVKPLKDGSLESVLKLAGDDGKDNWHQVVYDFLLELKKSNAIENYNQTAFLFRSVTNDKVVALANYLESKGIKTYSPRSKMFFDREEVKLTHGALLFLFPQFTKLREDIKGSIKEYYESCFIEFAKKVKEPANKELFLWARNKADYHKAIPKTTDYAFSGLFYELMQFPLFSNLIQVDLNSDSFDLRPVYNLAHFSKLINKFEYLHNVYIFKAQSIEYDLMKFLNQFLRFLIDGGIDEYEDFDEVTPSNCVSFMTIHQSKGLEFPIVFVDSLNNIPRNQFSDLEKELQENYYQKKPFEPIEQTKFFDYWRLFYVAFSRAKNLLILTGQEKLSGQGQLPSKYMKPYYNKIPQWNPEDHPLNKYEIERVSKSKLKNPYSFTSHILLYENCPQQYRFFKELEFVPVRKAPIIFGVLVHQTIEDIHRAILQGMEEKVTEENIENWFNANYNSITKKERVHLNDFAKNLALSQVKTYAKHNDGQWERIVEAEVDVSLVKDDYILQGTIDLIEGKDDTVEIVDFKTEKKLDVNNPKDKDKLDRYRRQLEVYSHIVQERTGKKVSKLHLYYTSELEGNPYISFNKDTVNIEETVSRFDNVVKRIEAKDFNITEVPEKKVCNSCDMRHYCRKCMNIDN